MAKNQPSFSPELNLDVLHHIYGSLPDLRDMINCMAVNKVWLMAGCTATKILYHCPAVEHVKQDEKRLLNLLNFAARKNSEVLQQEGPSLTKLSITSKGTFSNSALGEILLTSGAQLKQLSIQRHSTGQQPRCPCQGSDPAHPNKLELFGFAAAHCPGLEVLEFGSNGNSILVLVDWVESSLTPSLSPSPSFPSCLRSLSLCRVTLGSKSLFENALLASPQLKILKLECIKILSLENSESSGSETDDDGWPCTMPITCPNLEELSIIFCEYCKAFKRTVVDAPKLRVLNTSMPLGDPLDEDQEPFHLDFLKVPENLVTLNKLENVYFFFCGGEEIQLFERCSDAKQSAAIFPNLSHVRLVNPHVSSDWDPLDEEKSYIARFLGAHSPFNPQSLEQLELVFNKPLPDGPFEFALDPLRSPNDDLLLQNWPNLKGLRLIHCKVDVLCHVFKLGQESVLFPNLEELEVCFSHDLTKFGYVLESLPEMCPKLKSLALQHNKADLSAQYGFDRQCRVGLGVVVDFETHSKAFGVFNAVLMFKNKCPGVNVYFGPTLSAEECVMDEYY